MKKILYLLRGLPGSGKSTLATNLSPNICESDMFFMRDGEYCFDMDGLPAAHFWCRNRCESFMKNGEETIVVSNTLTSESEMESYLEFAKKYGYQVVSLIVENRHGNSSIHDVPKGIIDKMEQRLKNSIKLK
jgi:predicted kinase